MAGVLPGHWMRTVLVPIPSARLPMRMIRARKVSRGAQALLQPTGRAAQATDRIPLRDREPAPQRVPGLHRPRLIHQELT